MWFKSYIPDFICLIVKYMSSNDLIDTNRVFISGYSAGGDGVYHLGPMMTDILAGAAMMAGHPNNVELYNLRNTVFSIQVG
jgi:poly(3-hydroxybutyrate) depolymerase